MSWAQPTLSQFEAAFGEHIPAACECAVDELVDWRETEKCVQKE